jgi:NADH dehydrogenase
MELVRRYTGRWRPIISLPYFIGKIQGVMFEQLPENIFTISRDQVCAWGAPSQILLLIFL